MKWLLKVFLFIGISFYLFFLGIYLLQFFSLLPVEIIFKREEVSWNLLGVIFFLFLVSSSLSLLYFFLMRKAFSSSDTLEEKKVEVLPPEERKNPLEEFSQKS